MELFSKLYNCYYHVVSRIVASSYENPLNKEEIYKIISEYGFSESNLFITPKILTKDWNLLKEDSKLYQSNLKHQNLEYPLSNLQKSFIKAILKDPKICLFFNKLELAKIQEELSDIEPLFCLDDFYYFDKQKGGDCYEDENYRKYFNDIIESIYGEKIVKIWYESGKGVPFVILFLPQILMYSKKDDKFRVEGIRIQNELLSDNITINLGRIQKLMITETTIEKGKLEQRKRKKKKLCYVTFEIYNGRNAMERCMMHFANYEKHTEYLEERNLYVCTVYYEKEDETELLIQILSFGSLVKVLEPAYFLEQVKERILKQYKLFREQI